MRIFFHEYSISCILEKTKQFLNSSPHHFLLVFFFSLLLPNLLLSNHCILKHFLKAIGIHINLAKLCDLCMHKMYRKVKSLSLILPNLYIYIYINQLPLKNAVVSRRHHSVISLQLLTTLYVKQVTICYY